MRNLFSKKILRGLVETLLVVGLLVHPGMIRQVAAKGGYIAFLPLVSSMQESNHTFVASTTTWKYYDKGTQPSGWNTNGFNDSTWASGAAVLGYGNGGETTIVSYGSDSSHKYITTYFRNSFSVADPAQVSGLSLTLKRDDGAVVYLNGNRVYNSNMTSGTVSNTTLANSCSGATETVSLPIQTLMAGNNVLAVEVHQCSDSSSDLTFQASLTGTVKQVVPTATLPPPTATLPPPPTATPVPTQAPTTAPQPSSQTVVASNAVWKYFDKGTQPSGWNTNGFNDSTWASGAAVLGYGNGGETTIVSYGSDSSHKYITTYFRNSFSVADPAQVSGLSLTLKRDDGAVVYLNGNRVYNSNMTSGTVSNTTLANSCSGATETVSLPIQALMAGNNVLAVEVHQCSDSSSDLTFQASLTAAYNQGSTTPVQPAPTTAPTTAPTIAPTAAPTAAPTQPPSTSGKSFYVAPGGSSSNSGSISSPWDLKYALSSSSPARPGDTLWLRGGAYNYRSLDYLYSYIKGASGLPITVRAVPGERVVIDAALVIQGEWTTFWGLEMVDSTTDRTDNFRKDAFAVWKPNVKLINNIIHDSGGVGFWWQSENSEMYGNLIYNNGYQGTDRGHGHGIYTTNNTGTKHITDNVIFNNFSGVNIHAYSEKTYLKNFVFDGNVSFNGRFLVGGSVPASNITLTNNFTFRGKTRMGYSSSVTNTNLVMSNNIFDAENEESLELKSWTSFTIKNNQFRNYGSRLANLIPPSGSKSYAWNNSTYFSSASAPFLNNGSSQSWSTWRSTTGFDSSSTLTASSPAGKQIFVRPNKYESGRGNVVIYNWDKSSTVTVDISSLGFKVGETYVIHNAQNYFSETIRGTYNGSPISIPMTGWSIAKPDFWSTTLKPTTFPQFGVFIIARN